MGGGLLQLQVAAAEEMRDVCLLQHLPFCYCLRLCRIAAASLGDSDAAGVRSTTGRSAVAVIADRTACSTARVVVYVSKNSTFAFSSTRFFPGAFCGKRIHPTAKVSERTKRNLSARNTLEQLLSLYTTNPASHNAHRSVTDRRTDRRTT